MEFSKLQVKNRKGEGSRKENFSLIKPMLLEKRKKALNFKDLQELISVLKEPLK